MTGFYKPPGSSTFSTFLFCEGQCFESISISGEWPGVAGPDGPVGGPPPEAHVWNQIMAPGRQTFGQTTWRGIEQKLLYNWFLFGVQASGHMETFGTAWPFLPPGLA